MFGLQLFIIYVKVLELVFSYGSVSVHDGLSKICLDNCCPICWNHVLPRFGHELFQASTSLHCSLDLPGSVIGTDSAYSSEKCVTYLSIC